MTALFESFCHPRTLNIDLPFKLVPLPPLSPLIVTVSECLGFNAPINFGRSTLPVFFSRSNFPYADVLCLWNLSDRVRVAPGTSRFHSWREQTWISLGSAGNVFTLLLIMENVQRE